MTRAQLRELYLQQRDKHLSQFMAINGRATFAVLTLVVTILVATKDLTELGFEAWIVRLICGLLLAGAAALFFAAFQMSRFHTARIREFEERSRIPIRPNDVDFAIIPAESGLSYPFHWVVVGLVALTLATILLLYSALSGPRSAPQSPERVVCCKQESGTAQESK